MSLVICYAAKGGVGTTFLAAQLALGAARRGRQVTAVDLTGQDSLKLHFGVLPSHSLPDFESASHEMMAIADVNLIGASAPQQKKILQDRARDGEFAEDDSHLMIADIASGDRDLFDALIPYADLNLSALLPDPASLASLTQLARDVPVPKMKKTAFVLNQLDDRRKLSRHTHRFVQEIFGEQLIATVRRDEAVLEALANFETLSKGAPQSVVLPDLEKLTDAVLARCSGIGLESQFAADDFNARRAG